MHGIIRGSGETFWTEERIAEALRLFNDGLSANLIGDRLGTTRNAVIGKLHRCGVRRHGMPIERKQREINRPKRNDGAIFSALKARKEQERKIAFTATSTWGRKAVIARAIALGDLEPCEATDLPPEPTRPTVSLHDLQSHHCRWPIGDPASPDFGFCGEAIRDESVPYCTHHCRIAYRGRPAREDYYVAGSHRIMGGAYD